MLQSRLAIFEISGKPLELITSEIPELKEQELLIKNEYTTLCRSDLNTYQGKRIEKSPTILGHEITGRIAAFGPGASTTDLRQTSLKLGDRVTWAIFASDPNSPFSKEGMPQKSTDLFKYGHEKVTTESSFHGGLSEYTILRKNTPVIKIDEQIPLPVSSLINCAVATVAGAFRLAGDVTGKKVLITGAGMLGIIACAMARTRGAALVCAADTNSNRLDIARNFGADATMLLQSEQEAIKGLSFNISIDLSGAPDAMEIAQDLLEIGGTAIWIGATFPMRSIQIDAEKMVRRILTIKGLHNYNEHDLVTAVHFIEQHHQIFPFHLLVFDGFTLDTVNKAFEQAIDKNYFRAGVAINTP